MLNNVWCVKYLFKQQKEKNQDRHIYVCIIKYYTYSLLIDSSPINTALVKGHSDAQVLF